MVWPCEAIAAISSRAIPACAITSIAAAASHSPRSKLRRQYSAGVPPPSAAPSLARCAGVYECDTYASRSTSMRPSAPSVKRATAALIPSREVPDINPTTTPDDISAFLDRWWSVFRDPPYHAAILREQALGVLARDVSFLHYDRGLHALVSALEQPFRLV